MAKGLWPVINVANVDKSVEFYKTLGLRTTIEEQPGMGRWGSVELGGNDGLVIWPKDNLGPNQAEDTREWLTGELGKGVLFTIGVPNARKSWQKVEANRFDVDSPLTEQPWGGYGFNVVDPDGYVLNLTDKFPGAPPKRKTATRKSKPARGAAKKKPAGKKRR